MTDIDYYITKTAQLLADNERLRADFERLSENVEEQSLADDKEIMGLRSDVERLRAALTEISVMHPGSADDSGNVARNALWEGGEE